jgi:putative hydrolase of the HAD superfamily
VGILALNQPEQPAAAIFDLGGVLMDIAVGRTIAAWAAETGLTPEEVRRRLADLSLYHRYERGEITPEAFQRDTCRRLGCAMTAEAFDRGWNTLLGLPMPGVDALLADLAPRLRLVALTNTNWGHAQVWQQTCAATLRHFERVFQSWQMGCRKPEAACYQIVLDYLGLAPGRIVYFDDVAENVAAAESLGMIARCVAGPTDIARELESLGISPRAEP